MNKRTLIITLLAALATVLLSACQQDVSFLDDEAAVSSKIVRLGEDVLPDALLVKFASVPAACEVDAFSIENGLQLQRVFPSTPGKEELEARFGLDRWYEAKLPEGTNLQTKALSLARLNNIQLVEYQSILSIDSQTDVYPVSPAPTKGGLGSQFNDPYLSYQWHYKNYGNASVSPSAVAGADVNVVDVWNNLCCGDPSIVVAVVDMGVKYSHPDLKDNMWVNKGEIPGNGIDDDGNGYIDDVYGFNFVDNGPITWDKPKDDGHGTHCAGTIAAVNNNGIGVCGVAGGSGKGDGCRIMSCQVFSGGSGGDNVTGVKAIKYAADMGASIISCSFGYRYSFASDNDYIQTVGSAEIDAVHYFEASCNNDVLNGNIAIFASGNENHNYAHYPGAFYDIISVSAFGPDGLPTYYTNYGPGCNIAAPGGEACHIVNKWESMILSTVPSETSQSGFDGKNAEGLDYGYMQGTSMACPHVSGVVALALSYAHKLGKKFDRDEFKRMILSSVNDIDQRIAKTSEKTYAYYLDPLPMAPYYHQMGSGMIDAWRLMMKIEGVPTLTAQTGRQQWIDLSSTFGTASVSLTYLNVEVPEETIQSLGLQKITGSTDPKYPAVPSDECYAFVQYGRLYIHPTKIGSGKFKITAVGGGDHVGGGDNPPGGMEMEQDLSIVAREAADGGNGNGGWL